MLDEDGDLSTDEGSHAVDVAASESFSEFMRAVQREVPQSQSIIVNNNMYCAVQDLSGEKFYGDLTAETQRIHRGTTLNSLSSYENVSFENDEVDDHDLDDSLSACSKICPPSNVKTAVNPRESFVCSSISKYSTTTDSGRSRNSGGGLQRTGSQYENVAPEEEHSPPRDHEPSKEEYWRRQFQEHVDNKRLEDWQTGTDIVSVIQ